MSLWTVSMGDGNVFCVHKAYGVYMVSVEDGLYWLYRKAKYRLWHEEFTKEQLRDFAAEMGKYRKMGDGFEFGANEVAGYRINQEQLCAVHDKVLIALGDKAEPDPAHGLVDKTYRVNERFTLDTQWVPGLQKVLCELRCDGHSLESIFCGCDHNMTAYNSDMARRKIRELLDELKELLTRFTLKTGDSGDIVPVSQGFNNQPQIRLSDDDGRSMS